MRNNLEDVHNNLMEMMERLMEIDVERDDPEKIKRELKLADGVTKIAGAINNNVANVIKASKIRASEGYVGTMPKMLSAGSDEGK